MAVKALVKVFGTRNQIREQLKGGPKGFSVIYPSP